MSLVTFAAVSVFMLPRISPLASAFMALKIFATSYKMSVMVSKIAAASFGFMEEYAFT